MKKMLFSFMMLASLSVFAQKDGPCAVDAQKLCPGVKPGPDHALMKCMKEHKEQVSPACKASFEEKKAELKTAISDCKEDINTICKGVKQGGGRIIKCLKENAATLSPACKAHVEKK